MEIDTKSFAQALRSSLRQDPDVILVGEMRDLETVETGLTAAETGHLVMSTVHTLDATETINPNVTIPRDPCADSTGHHRTERPENVDPPRHDL